MEEQELFLCDCGSHEHQMFVWSDEEFEEILFYPHLHTHRNFFQRMWYAIKYTFGYKSRYGAWDEMILNKEDAVQLAEYINKKYNNS